MDISHITGPKKIQQPQRTKRGREAEATAAKSADRVNISAAAKQAADVARVKDIVAQTPEIRTEKVAEATARIAAGNYLTDKVADAIAEKIAESLIP